ncbi:hypothetical protein ULG90_20900 [Halopseudomonas pachastrellae]|nr:hypothetical protein ULG90_20900 [Halopseudomonas pachastrellae]
MIYVLRYNGHKLAAIEAKKESLSYTEGVRQAKDYAQRLQCRFGYAPMATISTRWICSPAKKSWCRAF